jgi:hypothetical protein
VLYLSLWHSKQTLTSILGTSAKLQKSGSLDFVCKKRRKETFPTHPPTALFSEGSNWLWAWSHNQLAELAAKRGKAGKPLCRCLATQGLSGSRGFSSTGERLWIWSLVCARFQLSFLLDHNIIITIILQHWLICWCGWLNSVKAFSSFWGHFHICTMRIIDHVAGNIAIRIKKETICHTLNY